MEELFSGLFQAVEGAPVTSERCPVFPGDAKRLYWDVPERSQTPTSPEEQLAQVRTVRDRIKARVQAWIAESRVEG